MSTPLSYDEVRELLPAYALGALDEQERAIVQSYLDRYPELRAEAARYSGVLHGLATDTPQRPPPPALKSALMARVVTERQQKPQESGWDRLVGALLSPNFALRAAFATLLIVVGALAIQTVRLSSQVTELQRAVAAQERLVRIITTGSEQVKLNGTAQASGANATIRFNPDEKYAAFEVHNLVQLPDTQAYQLWLVNAAGERWSGAVFNVPPDGNTTVLAWCETPMRDIVRFGVSIEPTGGSPEPTGPGVLRSAQS